MNSRYFRLFLCGVLEFSFIFSASKALAAGPICVATQPSESPELSQRIRIINWPNGKTITIIGQNHGDRDSIHSLLPISQNTTTSNDEWLKQLRAIINSNDSATKHASDEVNFIRKILTQHPEIKFLGLEASEINLKMHLNYSKQVRENILSQFYKRKIDDLELRRKAILLFAGSITDIYLAEPALIRNRSVFGFESDESSRVFTKR